MATIFFSCFKSWQFQIGSEYASNINQYVCVQLTN